MDKITDFHAHAFPSQLAQHAIEKLEERQDEEEPGAQLDGTIADLLRSMDRAGIARSVICSIATAPKQVQAILNWSLTIAGERIVPFASLHPDSDSPGDDVARIVESGLKGVKLHPQYQAFDLADRSIWPLFEAIEAKPLILALHCGLDFAFPLDDERAHPAKVLAIHEQFPDIPIIAGHMGGWKRWDAVLENLAGRNVYFETSYTLGYADAEVLQRLVAAHPIERIVFGTDSPWQDQQKTLEGVRELFPNPRDRRKVLQENARALLGETGTNPNEE